jgi:hypothetical protein
MKSKEQYPDTHIIQDQEGHHIRVELWDDLEELDMEVSLTIYKPGKNPKGSIGGHAMELTFDKAAKEKLIKLLLS